MVAAVAGMLGCVAVATLPARAQDTQSIVGSSPLYSLSGANGWINSKPLTAKELKGKVVLVDFWDYSCINCIRAVPYVRAWAEKYKDSGLVVIGVHTPEFDFEKQMANVQKAVQKFDISIRLRSTATTRSGMRFTISTGRLNTSSMRKARSATNTSVRETMTSRSDGYRSC